MKLRAAMLVLLIAVAPLPAAAQTTQVIGSVVNATAGAAVPSDLKVTVAAIGPDGAELQRVEAPLDAAHSFSAQVQPAARYVVAATHLGVTYSRVVEAAEAASQITLTIYETTVDESVITVASDTLTVVRGEGGAYEILQVIRVRNASDRTLAGTTPSGRPTLVRLPVAGEATDVTPGEGLDPRLTGEVPEGLATSQPMYPGETSLTYFYKLKGIRAGLRIDKSVVYQTERAHVLTGPGLTARADGFEFVEERRLGSADYRRYSSGSLAAGAVVVIDVAPATQGSRNGLAFSIAAVAGIGLLLTLGLIARARSRGRRPAKSQSPDRQELIRRIAILDEQHAAGQVSEADFQAERARMKKKLIELEP